MSELENQTSQLSHLKVGTAWIELEITGEPDFVLTFRGFAPVLSVRVQKSGLSKLLFVSAKSLAYPLDELRKRNRGAFSGLRIRIRKENDDPKSSYLVESI